MIGNDEEWSLDKHYILMNDIVLSPPVAGFANWSPIATGDMYFTGIFDGNNKTISRIHIRDNSFQTASFFGNTRNAEIKNLNLIDIQLYLIETKEIGGIASKNMAGVITNCHVSLNIKSENAQSYIGGIVSNNTGVISNCSSDGNISGGNYVGGLVSHNRGLIEYSYSKVNIDTKGFAGGLAAWALPSSSASESKSLIKNSYSTGDIFGNACAGGIVGYMLLNFGAIRDCYSTSIVGTKDSDIVLVGGIVGQCDSENIIEKCYFAGELKTTHRTSVYPFRGGIVGACTGDVIIRSCFSFLYYAPIVDGFLDNIVMVDNYVLRYEENLSKNEITKELLSSKKIYEQVGWDFSSENPTWFFDKETGFPKLV
jgi:The GLUG motif.